MDAWLHPHEGPAVFVPASDSLAGEAEYGGRSWDLAALASAAGMSRFHFHRLFRSLTGLTPKRIVLFRQRAFDRGDEMLNLREAFEPHQVRHLDAAIFADLRSATLRRPGC